MANSIKENPSIHSAISYAMDCVNTDEARFSLRCDAEMQRDALLDAIKFIGVAMRACDELGSSGHGLITLDLAAPGNFLMHVPDLIQGMNSLIDAYDLPASEVHHD